jgi:hypothetical protein
MRGVARMGFAGGMALVPARTLYEQELLFEHLTHRVRRDGDVALELEHHAWLVTLSAPDHGLVCACGAPIGGLAFRAEGHFLCLRCVRTVLRAGRRRFASLMGFGGDRDARVRESA